MSPKRARGVRYTKSVNRNGRVVNGWKPPCMVMALLALFIVAGPVVGACAFWVGVAAR